MTKPIPKISLTLLTAIASISGLFTSTASATPAYREVGAYHEPFALNTIMPSENTINVHYYGIDDTTKTNFLSIYWANPDQISEEEADAKFVGFGLFTPDWATSFMNKKAELSPNNDSSAFWRMIRYENSEVNLEDANGVLYYAVRLNNFDIWYGKVDYRDCLNNEYFTDGASCKLEKFEESGELYYWPYLDGERLGPDEEPAEKGLEEEDLIKDEPSESPEETPASIDEIEPEKIPEETEKLEDSKEADASKKALEESQIITVTDTAQNNSNLLKAPETGQNTNREANSANLAYLIVPTLGLIGLLAWWFVPSSKHSLKRKNRK